MTISAVPVGAAAFALIDVAPLMLAVTAAGIPAKSDMPVTSITVSPSTVGYTGSGRPQGAM